MILHRLQNVPSEKMRIAYLISFVGWEQYCLYLFMYLLYKPF